MSDNREISTGGGRATGRDQVGNDSIGGDQLHTQVGAGADKSVIGSKNVRQTTRKDSPDVTVNNYERNPDLVDRMEEKLEAQIDRLSDKMESRIATFESNMNWKLELVDRDIDELKHNAGRLWMPLLSIIASLVIALSLFYFAGGLYSLSKSLDRQRIEQGSGVYVKPQSSMGVGER